MSLRFVLGRAGSGKTAACLQAVGRAVREDPNGPPIIFLVPEQATFQVERVAADASEGPGSQRVQVLSFKRLARRVLSELGGGARKPIGDLGKLMVLRSLVERPSRPLALFAAASKRPGFVACLAGALRELRIYGISADALEAARHELEQRGMEDAPIALKLHDLEVLVRAYDEYLGQRYQDPDDYLTLASERISRSRLVRGATVWIDGFRGFTPQEYNVVAGLLDAAERVNVALCLDPGETARPLGEADLFRPTRETFDKLNALARERGTAIEEPVVVGHGRGGRDARPRSPALSHLEQEIGSRSPRRFEQEARGIRIVAAPNPRAEVEAAAREILRLCREEGMRFRDVGVIVPDLEAYHDLVQPIFKDHGIPTFIDRRRPITHHPLVELIRSAMEAISEGWTYDAVFRYLKTDLVPIARDGVDLLENFVLAHGIRGSRWTDGEPWEYRLSFGPEEDASVRPGDQAVAAAVNAARDQASKALAAFGEKVAGRERSVRHMARAVFELLSELGVAERLDQWRTEALLAGDLEAAREHEQTWNAVLDLLDEVVEALGDHEMDVRGFAEVVKTGLEGLTLGLIPPAIDQVMVGSVERSRHPVLRAALVLGATHDAFPRRVPEDALFSDHERDNLEKLGVALAPTSRLAQLDEQFSVYTALTRAREHLWISHPLADGEGRAVRPSMVVGQLRALFPALGEEFASCDIPRGEDAALDGLTSEEMVAATLVRHFRASVAEERPEPFWLDVYEWLVEDPARRDRAAFVLGSLGFSNKAEPLSGSTAREVFSIPLRTSVSRLERFAACPFAHFARDILVLSERAAYKLEPPGMGTFTHAALRRLFEEVGDDRKLASMSDDEVRALAAGIVDELAPRLQGEILLSSARYRYISGVLGRILETAASTLAEHARKSAFRPAGLEVSFGEPGGLPPLGIDFDDARRVEIIGRIDRVDVAKSGGGCYLRVIDYKSRRRTLKLSEVYYGLALQLLVYLAAALEHSAKLAGLPAEPAGALYFPVMDPIVNSRGPADDDVLEKQRKRMLRMSGLIVGDADVVKLMDRHAEGASDLVPAGITRDGRVARGRGTSVVTRDRYRTLSRFLRLRIRELAARMGSGDVAVRPYRQGRSRACQQCCYKPVCGFDILVAGNEYRDIRDMKDEEFWALAENAISREDGQ